MFTSMSGLQTPWKHGRRHCCPGRSRTSASPTPCSRFPDDGMPGGTTQAMPQQFTSWEAIYKTLRATFPDDRYHMGAAVSHVEQQGSQVIATLNGERKVTSDLLLAADGANSALRHRFVPDAAPNYAGYVAWRGTLDESDTPLHLLAFFDDAFTFSEARSGGHILAYFIPGEGTDIRPGRRRLNWGWYVRADEIELAGALVDKDGKHHSASLPQGLVSSDAVSKLRSRAKCDSTPKRDPGLVRCKRLNRRENSPFWRGQDRHRLGPRSSGNFFFPFNWLARMLPGVHFPC